MLIIYRLNEERDLDSRKKFFHCIPTSFFILKTNVITFVPSVLVLSLMTHYSSSQTFTLSYRLDQGSHSPLLIDSLSTVSCSGPCDQLPLSKLSQTLHRRVELNGSRIDDMTHQPKVSLLTSPDPSKRPSPS